MVTVAPVLPLKANPAGNEPGLIDHAYGAFPPAAVHVAKYATPTWVGPVVGVQVMASGAVAARTFPL